MDLRRSSFLVLACSIIQISASSQEYINGIVSTDTLIAGELNTIQMVYGYFDVENASAMIIPRVWTEDAEWCPECFTDTIRAVDIQAYNDTILSLTFDIHASAYPTTWEINLFNGEIPVLYYDGMLMFTRTYIHTQPQDLDLCLGETDTFKIFAYSTHGITYEWFRQGISIQREREPELIIEDIRYSDTGSYYCILDGWGDEDISSDTVRLLLRNMPDRQVIPEGPTVVNYSDGPLSYQIPHREQVTGYQWVLLPEHAGVIADAEDSVTNITWSSSYDGMAGLFVETRLGDCPGPNSDTLWIKVIGKPDQPEICIVGIDEAIEKCRIVWNKTDDPAIDSYNVYRETNEAGTFLKLATLPSSADGLYVDSTSAPSVFPHSYRLSVTDTLGNESEPSVVHTTMHLSSSVGTGGQHFLNWTHYQGYPFLSYEIYHGNNRDSIQYLDKIASNVPSYTVKYPLPGQVYYQIVARRSDGCNPFLKSGTDYGETRSNIDGLNISTETLRSGRSLLELMPNPAADKVTVRVSGAGNQDAEITLLNLLGRMYGHYPMENGKSEIDVSGFEPGLYLLRVEKVDGLLIKKLLIRR